MSVTCVVDDEACEVLVTSVAVADVLMESVVVVDVAPTPDGPATGWDAWTVGG